MNKELAIECIKTQRQFVDDMTREAFDMAIDLIKEKFPSADFAPVVRCKDCKYGDTGIDEEGKSFWKCIGIHYGGTKPMDFCSYGERKDDE